MNNSKYPQTHLPNEQQQSGKQPYQNFGPPNNQYQFQQQQQYPPAGYDFSQNSQQNAPTDQQSQIFWQQQQQQPPPINYYQNYPTPQQPQLNQNATPQVVGSNQQNYPYYNLMMQTAPNSSALQKPKSFHPIRSKDPDRLSSSSGIEKPNPVNEKKDRKDKHKDRKDKKDKKDKKKKKKSSSSSSSSRGHSRSSSQGRGKYSGVKQPPRHLQSDNDWICKDCKNVNFPYRTHCNKCKQPKEKTAMKRDRVLTYNYHQNSSPGRGGGKSYQPNPDDWKCHLCGNYNFSRRDRCNRCKEDKMKCISAPPLQEPQKQVFDYQQQPL